MNRSFWKNRKVLITGHTGFKGAWLSLILTAAGAEVAGAALFPPTEPNLFELARLETEIDSIIGDIREPEFLKSVVKKTSPEIIIHMAAQPLVGVSFGNPLETYQTNLIGTVNLFEAVRGASCVRAIVNVTSDKCYKNKEKTEGYTEADELGGYDPYSASKACAEMISASYVDSFFNPVEYSRHGIAVATARSGNVIGGGDWAPGRLVPDFIRAYQNNERIVLRSPSAIRPWQHVLEPLNGYILLAEKLVNQGIAYNGAWNFGPGKADYSMTVSDVVSSIESYFGIESSAQIWDQKTDTFHETTQLHLDSRKAEAHLDWKPVWNSSNSIKKTCEWYQQFWEGHEVRALCLNQINKYYQ